VNEVAPGGRIRSLDGLRGFAVLAVLLYHLNISWMRGGFLGVSVFFTLSGFVITRVLMNEQRSTGRIDLPAFYRRRLRRLMPASIVTVIATMFWLVAKDRWNNSLRADVFSILGQVANWRQVITGKGYGDFFGVESPFKHFWSLAIEEQFYLVFPALMIVVFRRSASHFIGRVRLMRIVLAVLIIASLALGHVGSFPGRYFRTDVRVAELLAGCLLALYEPAIARVARPLSAGGPLALVGLAAMFPYVTTDARNLYSLSLPLCTVLSVVVIASAHVTGSPLARVLQARPCVVVGDLSYAAYLVHWPIIVFVQGMATRAVLIVIATVALHQVETFRWLKDALSIRRVLFGLAAVAAAVGFVSPMATASARKPAVPAESAPTETVVAGPPLSIVVFGDSTGDYLAQELAKLPSLNVTNLSLQGCPMLLDDTVKVQLRPDGGYETWKTTGARVDECAWSTRFAAAPQADVVLLMFGPTMMANYRVGTENTDVTEPLGRKFLADAVKEMHTQVAVHGPRVVWLTAPVSQPPPGALTDWYWDSAKRADAWNDLQREIASSTGNEVIDFAGWLLAQTDPQLFRPDGTHLRGAGAPTAANWLAEKLRARA
jgi:peptidoglycan/LPS O-acetylase OafA/YrhL